MGPRGHVTVGVCQILCEIVLEALSISYSVEVGVTVMLILLQSNTSLRNIHLDRCVFDVVCLTLKKGEVRWEGMCVFLCIRACVERGRERFGICWK